jgi:pimeloyl-ACP methyl ester carboxylesterase
MSDVQREPEAMPFRTVEVPGAALAVSGPRDGQLDGLPAALFVHGHGGSREDWRELIGELGGELHCEAVDLPGFGYSEPPVDGNVTISGQVRAVIGYLEQSGSGPVHLFGNSLGGAVAVRVAARRPDLVRTLTLVSPALPDLLPRYGPARVAMSAAPGLGEWAVTRLRALPPERRIRATMAMCYADTGRVHPERLQDAVAELRRRDELPYAGPALVASARALVNEYFRRGADNLWRQAAQVTAPTLVMHGRHDRLVDPRMAMRAGRTFPDVRLVLLPHAGHVAQMEYPALVARHVRALIQDGARAAASGDGATNAKNAGNAASVG